jgi:dipeptidyl-peptidase-4
LSELQFPRQQALTRRFSLGVPRRFTIAPDGQSVLFLRSSAGDDPVSSLWAFSTATGQERLVADARALLGGQGEDLPPEERARRERTRELSAGIVDFAYDDAVAHAAFALAGRLWWAEVAEAGAEPRSLPAPASVVDPRPSPDGTKVAFLSGSGLYCVAPGEPGEPVLVAAEEGEVTWGAAEFIAAEEMGRHRGFWWAPDSSCLLAARADSTGVPVWWTADPAEPRRDPQPHRYPAAGTVDAHVSLWVVEPRAGGGQRRQVAWDQERYPYLAVVQWGAGGPPLLLVVQRDHQAAAVLVVDVATGQTEVLRQEGAPTWVDWVPGTPAWAGGHLVWSAVHEGARRLQVGDVWASPPGLQLAEVTAAGDDEVVFRAWSEPEVVDVWSWSASGGARPVTRSAGVATCVGRGRVKVVLQRSMARPGQQALVQLEGLPAREVADRSQAPVVAPAVRFFKVGQRRLSVGVALPTGHAGGKLPVVMAPYGGPGHQQVMAAQNLWLEAQWFADQGFAVVVVDGRGVPGRGPAWEREVYLDLAGPILQDQVDGLLGVAAEVPELDLGRVGIRGWSFGGYLSALAVLARPDVFHAAIAGAPVSDWRYYDTFYSERFLGHPETHPDAYERSSLLPLAAGLARPLMLVHGLADDNVYAVHSLALSKALFLARRPCSVLPLPGVTHVAGAADVTENLLLGAVAFFRHALAHPTPLPVA